VQTLGTTPAPGHTPAPNSAENAPLAPAGTQGPWTVVNVSFTASTMLLLTDGRVMVQNENAPDWWLLSPDATGSYAQGTWAKAAPMSKGRLYYASAVLKDGRVVVLGGEYTGSAGQTEDDTAEVYDPVANTWTPIGAPPGWSHIGDASCALLPDGRLLLGSIMDARSAIWDPQTSTWVDAGTKLAASSEESWVLLPDGSILTVDCAPARAQRSELWVAGTGWIDAGQLPVPLVEASSEEIGPGLLLADGRAFFVGATGHSAFYTPSPTVGQPGTWAAGPNLPLDGSGAQVVTKDAPAALLPNGHLLLTASSEGSSGWGGPTSFFDVDPTVNPAVVATVAAAPNNAQAPYEGRLMVLPNGQVMYSQGSAQVAILDPGVTPTLPAPHITSAPSQAAAGSTFQLTGTGYSGVSQTVGYGDDAAAATNYPLVRLTNTASNAVTYARTHDHSSMGVATGTTSQTTMVTLPASLLGGTYTMVVVANGVASSSVTLQVASTTCAGCVDPSGACQAGNVAFACGAGGAACAACSANQSCTNGACVANACTGCVDAAGTCQPGTTASACGAGGAACAACSANQSCTNGACVGSSTSCAHAICATGTALVSTCDPCASQICGADSFCCDTAWDTTCVSEVSSICGQTCP
jgi:hypothetical protein